MLLEKWYGEIQDILIRGNKRRLLPDVRKPKMLGRFYNCVAALMTQQLEDLCIKSIEGYVNFMYDYGVSFIDLFLLDFGLDKIWNILI